MALLGGCDLFESSDDALSLGGGRYGPLFGLVVDHDDDVAAVNSWTERDGNSVAVLFARDAQGRWDSGHLVEADESDVRMGWNLSVSGNAVAMSAPDENLERGVVYVYRYEGGAWRREARLEDAPEVKPLDAIGWSVSLHDDWLFVEHSSANLEGVPEADSTNAAGRVLVYNREPSGSWLLNQTLRPSDPHPFQRFGASSYIDGDQALVIASNDGALNGISLAGQAVGYIFQLEEERWVEQAKLVSPPTVNSGLQLQNIALDGDWAAIGHSSHEYPGGRGVVDLFRRSGGEWAHAQRLTASNASDVRHFGNALKMEGDRLVVTDPFGDGRGGLAWVFERSGERWTETAQLRAPKPREDDFFGEGVSLGEDEILVGASNINGEQGAVYLYRLEGERWRVQEP